jgi:hypothetical protein
VVICENCRKREASVGCLLCRRNLCSECFDDHMLRISADMDEGFAGLEPEPVQDDQLVACEICGVRIESAKKDEHLYEVHGISI